MTFYDLQMSDHPSFLADNVLVHNCSALTSEAQEGALKLLEDTPPHAYFFLCTTDPGKLKKAILTRCTKLPVELLSDADAQGLVKRVATKEGIKLTGDDLGNIVDQANGSARSLLVLLEKISNLDPKDRAKAIVEDLEQDREAIDLCRALIDRRKTWVDVAKIVRGITADPEGVRHAVLGFASGVLLGGDKRPPRKDDRAYNVLLAFEKNFYDSKRAGLVRAAFEALHT